MLETCRCLITSDVCLQMIESELIWTLFYLNKSLCVKKFLVCYNQGDERLEDDKTSHWFLLYIGSTAWYNTTRWRWFVCSRTNASRQEVKVRAGSSKRKSVSCNKFYILALYLKTLWCNVNELPVSNYWSWILMRLTSLIHIIEVLSFFFGI